MMRHFLPTAGLALTLAATVLGTTPTASVAAGESDRSSDLRIVLDCEAARETTTLTNRSGDDLDINAVGSLADRRGREPFEVDDTLRQGQSITYQTGENARGGSNVLTKRELYNDDFGREGAKIRTSEGSFKEQC